MRDKNLSSRAHKNWASKRMNRFDGNKGAEFILAFLAKDTIAGYVKMYDNMQTSSVKHMTVAKFAANMEVLKEKVQDGV